MATQTQSRKRAQPKLDLDDMERRICDFKQTLDREKRRCQNAMMSDVFEKLLREKLAELNGPDGQPRSQESEIKITLVDQENARKLANFLKVTVEMCNRIDQQEMVQDVLRGALKETRRKRFKSQQENPGLPLEPFCLFCSATFEPIEFRHHNHEQHRQEPHHQQAPQQQAVVLTQLPAAEGMPGLPRIQLYQTMTPPSSTVPTPDVGEQSRTYTPSFGAAAAPAEAQAPITSSPLAPSKQRQPQRAGDNGHSSKGPSTNASSSVAPPKKAQQQAAVAASTSGSAKNKDDLANDFIMASSDDDDDSSDDAASVRHVLEFANRSKLLGADDADTDERRCSTPLGQNPDGTQPHLVIDESVQNRNSPIKKPSNVKLGPGASSKSIKQQQQPPPSTRSNNKGAVDKKANVQPQQQQQQQQQQPSDAAGRSNLESFAAEEPSSRQTNSGHPRIKQRPKRGGANSSGRR